MRRRRKVCLVILLAAVSFVYLNIQLNNLAKAYTTVMQAALSRAFSREVAVDNVRSGLLGNIVLEGVAIGERQDGKLAASLSAKRLLIDFSLLDIALRRFDKSKPLRVEADAVSVGGISLIRHLEGNLRLKDGEVAFEKFKVDLAGALFDLDGRVSSVAGGEGAEFLLSSRNRYMDAAVKIKGGSGSSVFSGSIKAFERYAFNFKGNAAYERNGITLNELNINDIDIRLAKIVCDEKGLSCRIEPKEGSIDLRANFKNVPPRTEYLVDIKLDHVGMGDYNILSNITVIGNAQRQGDTLDYLDGSLFTSGTLIDDKPLKDMTCRFKFEGAELSVEPFKFGEDYILKGTIGLAKPYDIALDLIVRDAETADLVIFGKRHNGDSPLSGRMNGEIRVEGPLRYAKSKGHLESSGGNVGAIKYNSAVVNLEGRGTVLTVKDSRLIRDKGFLILDGELDLKDVGRPDILRNLKVRSDAQTIVWEGWDITKQHAGAEEFNMQRRVGEDFNVSFKTYVNDETNPRDAGDKEVELGYKLKGDKQLKMKLKEREELLSVEQKVKF